MRLLGRNLSQNSQTTHSPSLFFAMNAEQIVEQANREAIRLGAENEQQRSSIAALQALVESYKAAMANQAAAILESQATAHAVMVQRDAFASQVAFIEQFSREGAAASAAAIRNLEQQLYQANATGQDWSRQAGSLSAQTTRLQEEIVKLSQQSSEEKEKAKKNVETIGRLTVELSVNAARREESDERLRGIEGKLDDLTKSFGGLVAARDNLNDSLSASKKELQQNNRKQASVMKSAREQNEKLSKELEKAEARLQEHDKSTEDLRRKADVERKLQRELQKSLDDAEKMRSSLKFYQAQDEKHMKTISNYQKELRKLTDQDRATAFAKRIREKDVEIEKLVQYIKNLETQLGQKQRLVDMALARVKMSTAVAQRMEKDTAGWKGDSLANGFRSLVSHKVARMELAKETVDAVFAALRGIDSAQKAMQSVATIKGILSTVEYRMVTYGKDTMETIAGVNSLVADIKKLVESAKEPSDFEKLITDVRALQVGFANSLEQEKKLSVI